MNRKISRRDLIGTLGASGLAAGLGAFGTARADDPKGDDGKAVRPQGQTPRSPAGIVDGKVIQPRRELPVLHKTDVLVVGAGPAGVAAALAVQDKCLPRQVDVHKLQKILKEQDAYLG